MSIMSQGFGFANIHKNRVKIIIVFEVQGIKEYKYFEARSSPIPYDRFLNLVKKMEDEQSIVKISKSKPIDKFVKHENQFIPFAKLNDRYRFLLQSKQITVEYLYKNKRDELQRKLQRIENEVMLEHSHLKQLSQQKKLSKLQFLKRFASGNSTFQAQNTLQVKIKICLFISDPLMRNKSSPACYQNINVEEHVKVLEQSSNFQKSFSIQVQRQWAVQKNIKYVFPNHQNHKKNIRIVHFFTNIVRRNNELFIVFQDKDQSFGEEKLLNAKNFFEKIKDSTISLLIFIGPNVNLLKQIIPKQMVFSILLLSTYSPCKEQSFVSFIRFFYEHFFNRNQIDQSVSFAMTQYEKVFVDKETFKKNLVCCCFHEHKQNCIWTKIVQQVGISLAHKIFHHQNLKDKNILTIKRKLQLTLLEQFCLNAEQCGGIYDLCCCQQSHLKKTDIMEKKIIFFPRLQISEQSFLNLQNSNLFVKNTFTKKFIDEKMIPFRRYSLLIYEVVKKILNNKQRIIQVMGSRRIGKSPFIDQACKYIQNRLKQYVFQNIDDNEGSLQECVKFMWSQSRRLKKDNKTVVFIHHNSGMMIEKQSLKLFNQNIKNKLPFTFLIKINSQQQQGSQSSLNAPSTTNQTSMITFDKLSSFEILKQIYFQLNDCFFQENANLEQIITFCKAYDKKLTFRTLRNFLKYYDKYSPDAWTGKYNLSKLFFSIETSFTLKIKNIETKNKQLFNFLGFLSQFPEGIYLTKLTKTLLKQYVGIQEFKEYVRSRQNINYFFEVISKPSNFRSANIKIQKIDLILPDDKLINYFKHSKEYDMRFNKMKLDFFHAFFNFVEALIFKNLTILRKKHKKQRNFLQQGIFMLNSWKNDDDQDSIEKNKLIQRTMKYVWNSYKSLVDNKFVSDSQDKKNQQRNSSNTKGNEWKFMNEKILSLILYESEKFILHRHIPSISAFISSRQKREQNKEIQKQVVFKDQNKKCPIVFYKSILFACKVLLKQPQKYESIQKELKNLQPSMLNFFKKKGNELIQGIIDQHKHKSLSKTVGKSHRSHKSFHHHHTIQLKKQNSLEFEKKIQKLTFQSYFKKLLSFLQIKVIIDRRQCFSVSFGDSWMKRREFNQANSTKLRDQKFVYEKELGKLLPKLSTKIRSQSNIQHYPSQFSAFSYRHLTAIENRQNLDEVTIQQLMIQFMEKLLLYETEEQFINYFKDEKAIVDSIDQQIRIFKSLSNILSSINKKCQQQNHFQTCWFLDHVKKEQIAMQIVRLCMRKIQFHFKVKTNKDKKLRKSIQRLIDINNFQDFQKNVHILKESYKNSKSAYFQNERVAQYLKNAQICQKYIDFICQKDKVTEQFTVSIGQVDPDYMEIFSYLCEQTWKKTLFNGSNNIVFFKSKVIVSDQKPLTFVRKRNVAMKYMLKMLGEFKINMTFLHLTKNNFNYIQKDKQNPDCKIKYLVLTVDAVQQNNELVLMFEQQKNITQEYVKFSQFLLMMSQVDVQFIILMGKNARKFAKNLSYSLKINPIVIGIQSSQYDLSNFVKYIDLKAISQKEQFQLLQSNEMYNRQNFTQQICQYMSVESFHCILDLILCSLMTDLVYLPYKKSSNQRNSLQSFAQTVYSLGKIKQLLDKSIRVAIKIMRSKWEDAKQIKIDWVVHPEDPQNLINLKRNSSSLSALDSNDVLLTQRISSKDLIETVRYFPSFSKGTIVNNTSKLYDPHLQSEDYYEYVNRNQQLFTIMSFVKQQGRRMVEIFGSQGAGKSSLLKEVCWINFIHRLFKDGVYLFDLKHLEKSSQTLMLNIQLIYKQSKLFSLLEDDLIAEKNQQSTILLGLDNLDKSSIKQNQDFFQKLKGKPICVIYSTNEPDLQNELSKYLRLNSLNINIPWKKRNQDSDNIISSVQSVFKVKSSQESKFSSFSSYSIQLQSKKSLDKSEETSQTQRQQIWSFIKIDINNMSRNALFNIALSYLKKQQLSTLKIGMKEFIQKHFSLFLANLIDSICAKNTQKDPYSCSNLGQKKQSMIDSKIEPNEQSQFSRLAQKGEIQFNRTKSSILTSSKMQNKKDQTHRPNKVEDSLSVVSKMLKSLDEYFKNLGVEKVFLNESQTGKQQQVEKVSLIDSFDESIVLGKKDSRLWFYEDCFEKLMIENNSYDLLEVVFH